MQTRASCLHAFFYHPVSKDGGTFQNRIAASESSAFSSHGKHRIPANAPNTPRTDRGIDIEPWSRFFTGEQGVAPSGIFLRTL